MNEDIQDDVQLVMQHIYNEASGTHGNESEEEIIHVHHFPDAQLIELPDGTVIFKKSESTTSTNIPIVESEPHDSPATQPFPYLMLGIVLLCCIPMLASMMLQVYVLQNPPIATLTIFPKSQQVTLTGTLQLGRLLHTITLSQSQTTPTTGHGHQDARAATGELTFYNGSNTAQTINAGTSFTGNDGVQVATDQTVTIPPNNPPVNGQATVAAHALVANAKGNIAADDINLALSSDLTVKNLTAFTGGQDERSFQTVAKSDIDTTAATLKPTLDLSMQGALAGQLKNGEALVTPHCTPTITADHQPGEESTTVKVTVNETCSAVAYNQDTLQAKVTDLLDHQAAKTLGTGYSILEKPHISITQATINHTSVSSVTFLSFNAQSIWIYALTAKEQNHMKNIIAGNPKNKALELLASLPGIERVAMQSSGFGDDTRIPKDISHIHLLVIYAAA